MHCPTCYPRESVHDPEREERGHIDLQNNLSARIKNPLQGLSETTLLAQVDIFADQQGLTDIKPLLRTGALVAQNPHDYESIPMSEEHRDALRVEATSRWAHTKTLYYTIALCSIGAAVQ